MSDIRDAGGPDPDEAGAGEGTGIDADAFSPVIDPDLVPAETPAEDEAKRQGAPDVPEPEVRPGH